MVQKVPITIQDVFAGFLRAAADNQGLKAEVMLEGVLTGEYLIPDGDSASSFAYGELATIIYRPHDNPSRHAFYFIPEIKFHKTSSTHLRRIADTVSTSRTINSNLEIIADPAKKLLWPPKSTKEKEVDAGGKGRLSQTSEHFDEEDDLSSESIALSQALHAGKKHYKTRAAKKPKPTYYQPTEDPSIDDQQPHNIQKGQIPISSTLQPPANNESVKPYTAEEPLPEHIRQINEKLRATGVML